MVGDGSLYIPRYTASSTTVAAGCKLPDVRLCVMYDEPGSAPCRLSGCQIAQEDSECGPHCSVSRIKGGNLC